MNFLSLFTVDNIIYAALLAFMITVLINYLPKIIKAVRFVNTELMLNRSDISQTDLKNILNKCYLMFPNDNFKYMDETIQRGMKIKITTDQNKIFEGEFLGLNNQKVLCMLTSSFLVAHALDNIISITKEQK